MKKFLGIWVYKEKNMVLQSIFNNWLIKFFFKSNAITIRGRSKIRLKKHARFEVNNDGSFVIGYGDGATATFRHSGSNLELLENSKLIVNGDTCVGYNSSIRLEENAQLIIGSNTYISSSALIRSAKSIEIGNNCAISWNVTIMDSDFHDYKVNGILQENTKEVIIEDNVWIGNNVIILKGVHIGKNAIVAAGSVVTRNVEPFSAVGGNPAKKIKSNVDPVNIQKINN